MEYRYTRSGLAPHIVADSPRPFTLRVRCYEPKPAWMDHIPGPWLRFASRFERDAYLRRTRKGPANSANSLTTSYPT